MQVTCEHSIRDFQDAISAGEDVDELKEKGLGSPLIGNEEDDEEKLLRQAIALCLEGTEEADKEDEELLKQAITMSLAD